MLTEEWTRFHSASTTETTLTWACYYYTLDGLSVNQVLITLGPVRRGRPRYVTGVPVLRRPRWRTASRREGVCTRGEEFGGGGNILRRLYPRTPRPKPEKKCFHQILQIVQVATHHFDIWIPHVFYTSKIFCWGNQSFESCMTSEAKQTRDLVLHLHKSVMRVSMVSLINENDDGGSCDGGGNKSYYVVIVLLDFRGWFQLWPLLFLCIYFHVASDRPKNKHDMENSGL